MEVTKYAWSMVRRTSIEIDPEKLVRVQEVLGTKGLKDTVEGAFDEVLRANLRRRLAQRLMSSEGIDRGPDLFEETRPTR